ncbi:hypothetical protein ACFO1B_01230 [Dactylosporangium siamense]|uniref:hypothetical protein n=1 Tax=Dactylosporangium siamense TaxID=685454 RepID=UPI0036218D04
MTLLAPGAEPRTAAPGGRMMLALFAGRGAFRATIQLTPLALAVPWGAARFADYAGAVGVSAWTVFVAASGEKAALKLVPRARRLGSAVVRVVLRVAAVPVVAAAVAFAAATVADRGRVVAAALLWSAALGLLQLAVGLHRVRGRVGTDAVTFAVMTGVLLALSALTFHFAWSPLRQLTLLATAALTASAILLWRLPPGWSVASWPAGGQRVPGGRDAAQGVTIGPGPRDRSRWAVVDAAAALLGSRGAGGVGRVAGGGEERVPDGRDRSRRVVVGVAAALLGSREAAVGVGRVAGDGEEGVPGGGDASAGVVAGPTGRDRSRRMVVGVAAALLGSREAAAGVGRVAGDGEEPVPGGGDASAGVVAGPTGRDRSRWAVVGVAPALLGSPGPVAGGVDGKGRRRRVAWLVLRTCALLGLPELLASLCLAVCYLVLGIAGHGGESGPFYVAVTLSGFCGAALIYLFRLRQPATSLRLRGTAGRAGRAKARRILRFAALLCLPGLPLMLVLPPGTLLLALLTCLETPLFALVAYATYLVENTDGRSPRLTAAAAGAGLVVAAATAAVLVPAAASSGAMAALLLSAGASAISLDVGLGGRWRARTHGGP